jgi:hypothetical protein
MRPLSVNTKHSILSADNSELITRRMNHPPPAGMKGWYRFMDDLETISEHEADMVIIIDNAMGLFIDPKSWAFELITVWVLQLPGWQRRRLPCHLSFQMDPDPAVEAIYGPQ